MPTLETLRAEHQRLMGWFRRSQKRLQNLEDGQVVRVVDELPSSAPANMLLRTKSNGSLYLGNGPGQPLSRFNPAP